MGVRVHYNIAPFYPGGGATIEREDLDDSDRIDPQRAKVGEIQYARICLLLDRVMSGQVVPVLNDPDPRETDRAFLAGVDAVLAQLTTLAEIAALDTVVHQAWYQGMIYQGREVAPDRRHFDSLSANDRLLDAHIARIVVQQAALTAGENVKAARAMGDTLAGYATPANAGMGAEYMTLRPEPKTVPAEKLWRDIVATDDALDSINLTPKEWRLLVADARRERNATETRLAHAEELRRKDNAAWWAERDEANTIIARLQGENAALAVGVDDAISDRHAAEEAAKVVEVERDRLLDEIESWKRAVAAYVTAADESGKAIETQAREVAKLREEIAALRRPVVIQSGSPTPMTPEQAKFYGEAASAVPANGSPIVTVAAMAHEVSTVRLMVNSPRAKSSDTEGIRRRCATIAGCAFSLAMTEGTIPGAVPSSNWQAFTDAAAERAAEETHERGMDRDTD